MGEFAFHWLSVPYAVLACALIACAVLAVTFHGDRVLRLGVLGTVVGALPWALTSAIAANYQDAAVCESLLRLGLGPVGIIGPALLFLLLSVSGQVERHRKLARLAALFGIAMLGLTWTTDLIMCGVYRTPSGVYYTSAGPLMIPHIATVAFWGGLGAWVIRHTLPRANQQNTRTVLGILVIGSFGIADTLLAYEIAGWFPLAWLPGCLATGIAIRQILRFDLLRKQGWDHHAIVELTAVLCMGAIAWAAAEWTVVGNLGLLTRAFVAATSALVMIFLLRRWRRRELKGPPRDQLAVAIERWEHAAPTIGEWAQWERHLATLWSPCLHASEVRILQYHPELEALVHPALNQPLPQKVAHWFGSHRAVVLPPDLATIGLGEIRSELEAAVAGWDLWAPIVSRNQLWAMGVARLTAARALSDRERELAAQSAATAGRALELNQLTQKAVARAELARELELAKALATQTSWGIAQVGTWRIDKSIRSHGKSTFTDAAWRQLDDGLACMIVTVHSAATASALIGLTLLGAFSAAVTLAQPLFAATLRARVLASLCNSADRDNAQVSLILVQRDRTEVWLDTGHALAAYSALPTPRPLEAGLTQLPGPLLAFVAQIESLGDGPPPPAPSTTWPNDLPALQNFVQAAAPGVLLRLGALSQR